MTRNILLFILILVLQLSCTQTIKKQDVNSVDSTSQKKETDISTTPIYFDYKNTLLTEGYIDTAFANFSSDTSKDCFTISVPKGLIIETKTTIRIISMQGKVIYEHIFPTSDLVNGYATEDIKSDLEMQKYVLTVAKSLLKDGLQQPSQLSEDSYLNQATKEDFNNYDVFVDIKNTNKFMLHYCLNEESHYYLGYSIKKKKVVEIIYCC